MWPTQFTHIMGLGKHYRKPKMGGISALQPIYESLPVWPTTVSAQTNTLKSIISQLDPKLQLPMWCTANWWWLCVVNSSE